MRVDPEIKKLLIKNLELAEENNKMLRSMRRQARFGTIFRVLYWLVIVGASLGAYIYIQPYVQGVLETYQTAAGQLNAVGEGVQKLNSFLPN